MNNPVTLVETHAYRLDSYNHGRTYRLIHKLALRDHFFKDKAATLFATVVTRLCKELDGAPPEVILQEAWRLYDNTSDHIRIWNN
jgi:hypothetical protein